ncbi:MAG: type II toxin-antitoxin system RelE/ParE family toxin [Reyranella sp.]|nr:type II toxin-antitoxin system RelE/ParE family toxin [Reyranella sp.]
MAYSIRYLPQAVRQLDEIFTYIADRNPAAAGRVAGAIRRSIERLGDFPYSSRPSEVPSGAGRIAMIGNSEESIRVPAIWPRPKPAAPD